MLRNPYNRTGAEMRRVARTAARTAADMNRGSAGTGSTVQVGAADPTTGEWAAYSLLDWTLLGDGFRLA